MANKIITVTSPSVVTNDTLASYNAYSNIDGLLGALSIAEAAAGKTFAMSDGSSHNITVKPVGTTNGEFNQPSNIVVVDLSVTADPVVFTLDTLVEAPTGVYKASANSAYTDNGVSVSGHAGDFDFEIELNNSTYNIDGCMMGVSTASTVGKYNQAPNWEFGAYIQDLALNPRTVINGVAGDPTDASNVTYGAGNKLRLVRVSNNLKLYYNNEERHDFGTIAGTLYLRIAGHVDNYILNPKVTV